MRPFTGYIARKVEEIDRRYAAYLERGFPTDPFEGEPEPETLQCRNEHDRTNWIGLLLKCQAAIAVGGGDLLIDPPIRCTSNRMYAVTYIDAQTRMYALLAQVAAAQANWWRLKDEARAVTRREDLNLMNLDEGWP